jgi:hypothetical protein
MYQRNQYYLWNQNCQKYQNYPVYLMTPMFLPNPKNLWNQWSQNYQKYQNCRRYQVDPSHHRVLNFLMYPRNQMFHLTPLNQNYPKFLKNLCFLMFHYYRTFQKNLYYLRNPRFQNYLLCLMNLNYQQNQNYLRFHLNQNYL